MPVTQQTPYNTFTAAPGATVFSSSFRVIQAADLVIRVNGAVRTTGFTVSGLGAAGGVDVTFTTPMTGGELVELLREVPLTRATDYQQLGDFLSPMVNLDFDRIWHALQTQGARLGGAVRAPFPEQINELPAASARAGRFLRFDDAGNPIASTIGSIGGTVTDASLVEYLPAGTGAVATNVQTALREVLTATRNGPITLATLNAVIADTSDGTLTVPAGQYTISGDVLISLKNPGSSTGGEGFFTLDCTGVRFSGAGRIIVDSCKRVKIVGLDAPGFDLHWRGVWWCKFQAMRYRNLVIGDGAGSSFSSQYWNQIEGGQSQAIIHDAGALDPCNEITFIGHTMRGNAGQGFSGTAPYAFSFIGNKNCQGWKFYGSDVSYHTTAVYRIDAGNTSDVEIYFDGTYFDSNLPEPSAREKTRIVTSNCHHANGTAYEATLSAAGRGSVDLWRQDRSFRHLAFSGYNLIPNGDFRERVTTWNASADRPIGTINSATVTANDGGLSGTFLTITQALTTSNAVRFKAKPLPYSGPVTGTIVLRNADAGSRTIRLSIAGLFHTATINDTDLTVVTLTQQVAQASGSTPEILVLTIDGTAFNVQVAYVGMTMGEGGPLVMPSTENRTLMVDEVYDPASLAAGASVSKTFTVPGAAVGDFAIVSPGVSLGSLYITAPTVVGPDQVRLYLFNPTGGAIDLASSTWRIKVFKRSYA